MLKRRLGTVSILSVLMLQSGCGRPDRELPNGYSVVRTNGYTVIVMAPDGSDRDIVIGPKVTGIGVRDALVFGQTVRSPQSEFSELSRPGYFVLDTSSGEVNERLSEAEWRDLLHKRGISEPRMRRP